MSQSQITEQINLILELVTTLIRKKINYKIFVLDAELYSLSSSEKRNLNTVITLIGQVVETLRDIDFILVDQKFLQNLHNNIYSHDLKIKDVFERENRILGFVDLLNKFSLKGKSKIPTENNSSEALSEARSRIDNLIAMEKSESEINDLNYKIIKAKECLDVIEDRHSEVLSFQNQAESVLNDLRGKNQSINSLIDSVGNAHEKKLYEKIYDLEILIANNYRNYAFIIFSIVGSIALFIFSFSSIQNTFHLYSSTYFFIPFDSSYIARVLTLFSLTAPAWYLTMESSKHRKVAYKAKILGTELESLPYYMNQLSNEQRIDMRIKMVDKFFGQSLYNDEKNDKSESSIGAKTQLELTTAILKLAEAIKKS